MSGHSRYARTAPTNRPECYPEVVQITLDIPEELAAQIIAGKDPALAALEAIAVDGYRTQRLSESEVRRMMGYQTRMQVHALLKEHDIYLHYTMADWEQDKQASDSYLAKRALGQPSSDPPAR
jgi:hypothetical protein